ncbi:MAG: Mur ligase domain-containing protein, partial [Verrucomicrobiota bacterium]|nr:Mur ligase domain-containing protein [Verrucomicrobiota bacterium]
MIDISKIENVHFIGIGGTGMNGLAQLALLNNFNVSGSDRKYDPLLSPFKELEKMGIKIFLDNGSFELKKNTLIVYSTAIEKKNKDLIKSNKNKLLKLHRVDFLNNIIPKNAEIIAITGTAG